MDGKFLGKITHVEFGLNKDYPFLYGLELTFQSDVLGVSNSITTNIKEVYGSHADIKTEESLVKQAYDISQILKAAKVNYVSQLLHKPVEVELEQNTFKSFRILSEVL